MSACSLAFPPLCTSLQPEQTISRFAVSLLGNPLLVVGSSLPLLSTHFFPRELPFNASIAIAGACLLGAIAVHFSYQTVVSLNQGKMPDLKMYLSTTRKLFYEAVKYFNLISESALFLYGLQRAHFIELIIFSSPEICAITLVVNIAFVLIATALKKMFPMDGNLDSSANIKELNSSHPAPQDKPLSSQIGEVFAAVAGSLPVISAAYIPLPLPFSFSLGTSGLCFCAALATFWIGQKWLLPSEEISVPKASLQFQHCVQYTAYRSLKSLAQCWCVATGHLLAQKCLVLTPLVVELSPLMSGASIVAYLFIEIFALEALRLSEDQKKESGFVDF